MSQSDQPFEAISPLGGQSLLLATAIALGRLVSKPRTIVHVLSYLRRRVTGRAKAVGKNLHLYIIDLALALAALSFASFMRLGLDGEFTGPESHASLLFALPCFLLTCAVVFPVTCLYTRNWRYASVGDMLGIVRAAFVTSLAFVFLMFVATRLDSIPRSVIVIQFLLLVPLLISVRIRSKLVELSRFGPTANRARNGRDVVPVLLIGAGDAADLYIRALQRDPNARHWPVGVLDNGATTEGYFLRGVPVLGSIEDFDMVIGDLEGRGIKPRHVIFTERVPGLVDPMLEALIDRADRLGIAVSRPAPVLELRNPKYQSRFDLRPIELTDLLERPQAVLDKDALSRMIENRRIVVTGAGGSIGGELTQQIAALGPTEVVLIDNSEYNLYAIDLELAEKFPNVRRKPYICDVRDPVRLGEIFRRHRVDLVFHAAALKHVPMVELNPCEGILTNVIGTMNVAEATRLCGAKAMVQISTDKVVNTTSVMGATKRLAELYCQSLDLAFTAGDTPVRFMTVRFGNVLGSSGSLIPLFKRQLAHGGPLTVTDMEMKRFFMTIREAVELTLQASAHGLEKKLGQGEIFVLDMGAPIKIIDMARRMIKLAGFRPDEDIKIKIVGCRPGEKLFEELFDESERRVDVPISGVLGAVPNAMPLDTLRKGFSQLRRLARAGDTEGVLNLVADMLPSYRRDEAKPAAAVTAPFVPHVILGSAKATTRPHEAAA
ncbi:MULTISPECIES: nucleoside-diphosphate sugar epimerase/dehydratase [unclassified Mesorhizobium]|uniref:nucleoside-diphosphate sugar epimerase/dehydratase n=1 Tax=unclassified Mesorhizobium TaxID=325217 RepID=UPI0011266046|nr:MULTISPECIES: nucleoside-diphosphate sugar epimerase/dehydratase [unclassified Mesorhizobium]TPK45135.1 polysaccharide biosynthesis protein [Mesorhizobium sp. B2-5-2]TPL16030.1 polysaccharide biosynthesis protein [Mesorhizobium sp. B2-4-9]TPL17559.1 polysaccharide biosynthesis protein [Mesorhizobium sp. B2-4-7]TPL33828.1 polysaccharide biosynthesis protein [Mesorhizobium sp. B2-4-5]TPL47081.1 polysaccharide biosynthesis protein [Mesorhizobium sp. B2-4-4]